MRTTLLLSFFLAATALTAQTVYQGNGNTGFGGPVGPGSLSVSDDGTTASFTFTRGGGELNDALVLYVDSRPGGVALTADLTDVDDPGRRATSGTDGLNRSTVTFATGFTADFAIVVENTFVGLFELVENGMHNFVTSGNLTANPDPGNTPDNQRPTYGFDFDFAELGVATGPAQAFAFVGTYLNAGNAYRSNEAFGPSDAPGTNIGHSGSPDGNGGNLAFTGSLSYVSGITLPVRLARLSAEAVGAGVEVSWATASESSNAGFAVERSADGETWVELAFVAGFGDSHTERAYGYRDGRPLPGESYYRLRQLDYDGGEWASDAVAVRRSGVAPDDFALELVGAHPITGPTLLRNPGDAAVAGALHDLSGRLVLSFRVGAGADYRLDAATLAAGPYLLRAGRTTRRLVVR